jgi:arylsulfatase A-like enzyme
VVLINLESVGAEYCALYGSKHDTTPNLERLVKERGGIVFDNYYVAVPYSCKSMIALSHSVYPRLDWKLIVSESLDFDVPMISQVLQNEGYRVCYAHSGYWSWRGRDRYLKTRVDTLLDAEQLPDRKISSWGVEDKAMYEAALDWVDAEPGKPFYLYAFTIETHHPYATPHAPMDFDVDDEDLQDYLNSIRAADENIAWFFGELEKRKLLEDTLVIVTSDNGEAFGQHNQRSHNFCIYQSNVHLPLVLFHPSLKGYPQRMKAPREQIDIAPTILDALNVPSPAVWQGRNLFRENDPRPAYFFCVGNDVQIGLRDGGYKYTFYVGSGAEELYDIELDPRETKNLADDFPDRCADYRKRVAGMAKYQRPFLRAHGAD